MLVISAHADTNFSSHKLKKLQDGAIEGHLDNFSGVHAVMKAYFSGKLDRGNVRVVDVYSKVCSRTCFIGVPVTGGDYNAGVVECKERSLNAIVGIE